MVGDEQVDAVVTDQEGKEIPIFPSDHFGVCATLDDSVVFGSNKIQLYYWKFERLENSVTSFCGVTGFLVVEVLRRNVDSSTRLRCYEKSDGSNH